MAIVYATKIDNASGGFVVGLVKTILYICLIFGCAVIMGFDSNSLLVAFSSVALAIGLALKDSLSNIASGIVIIAQKPFKKGDYIQIGDTEGTVKKITVLSTELITPDNKKIVVPNNTVSTSDLINYSSSKTRRISMVFGVSYGNDIDKVQKVLANVVKEEVPYALKTPDVQVFLSNQSASSLDFTVRFWVNTRDYWTAYNMLNGLVYKALMREHIDIPFNQLDVHVVDVPASVSLSAPKEKED